MLNKTINSKLDHASRATLVKKLRVTKIISEYKKQLNIDVSEYLKGIDEVGIYECVKTNYKFYYPFNVDGDSQFYEKLQDFDWYYMPWKWEHEISKRFIKSTDKILEIGSGGLGFVKKMNDDNYMITGLELNEDSILKAKEKKLNIVSNTVQYHASLNAGVYDIVCSYQVLEHISEVNSFIQAKIDCLKPGGKMIIAVPNNDSFIKYTRNFILNGPPHHMGLWSKSSLLSVAKLFDLKVQQVLYEPLQIYHAENYVNLTIERKIFKYSILRKLYRRLKLKKHFISFVTYFRNLIKGHTILVVYQKTI